MRSVVLLVVGAAWVAVLLPPLLRSRLENRPGSSIDSFQSRLSSLQRSVPSAGVRSMARPLAGSQRSHDVRYGSIRPMDVRYAPQRVGSGQHRPAQRPSGYAAPAYRAAPSNVPVRFDLRGTRHVDHNTYQLDRRVAHGMAPQHYGVAQHGASQPGWSQQGLQRREETRGHAAHRQTVVPNRYRATVKQRRQNVLFMLILSTVLSGLLVAAVDSSMSKAVLVVSSCALVGYIYLLAQMRRSDHDYDEYYASEAA